MTPHTFTCKLLILYSETPSLPTDQHTKLQLKLIHIDAAQSVV